MVLLAPAARAHLSEVTSGVNTYARLPSEFVLDVMALAATTPPSATTGQYCAPWTSPKYDRAPAPLRDFLVRQAITRKSLGLAAGGNEILQRTKNSARDFMLAEPLKRSLDK